VRIGEVVDETPLDADIATLNARVDESPVRVLDPHAAERIVQQIDTAREAGTTLGGVFESSPADCRSASARTPSGTGASMVGIGEAFLALNAIKGVELGLGFVFGVAGFRRARCILSR